MNSWRLARSVSLSLFLAAGCSASSGSSPPPQHRVDIQGRVVGLYGLPAVRVSVSVNGAPAQLTDSEGRFHATGITPPYAIAVGQPAWSRAVVWSGLRRADPVLTFSLGASSGQRIGYFCGDAAGTDPASTPPAVLVETPTGSTEVTYPMSASGGAYCAAARWMGGEETAAATVHVLQANWTVEGSDRFASGFPAYGTTETTLAAGDTLAGVDLALAPVNSTSFSVGVALPEGWIASFDARGFFGPRYADGLLLAGATSTPPWPSFAVPVVPGLRTHVRVFGYGPGGSTHVHEIVEAGTTAVDVAVDLPPALSEPADGAASVGAGTRFAWAPFPGGDLNVLVASCSDGSSVQVLTEATVLSLPDTSAAGVSFPAGGNCTWSLTALAGTGGIDALAAGPAEALTDFPTHDSVMALSVTRRFTAR